jgi:transposase
MTILGVDVSKDTIDVTLGDAPKGKEYHQFANNKAGFRALRKWLGQRNISKLHVCMEATNIYWEALALFCYDEGWQVSVVNPARIKGFAKSQMRRNKTDPEDSDIIADFCALMKPRLWHPPSPEERKLRDLLRHQHALQKTLTQQTNRLHTCQNEDVCNSLQTIIGVLRTEITQVEEKIQSLLQSHPDLKQRFDFLHSIKGIGSKTALFLLAEMHDLADYENARAAAADAGVTPSHYQSGTSVKRRTKISKIGKAGVRAALYWPAITAIQHNPLIKAMAERLKARGKSQKVIIGAAMRKLLHLAYGVLKNQSYFDPNYVR